MDRMSLIQSTIHWDASQFSLLYALPGVISPSLTTRATPSRGARRTFVLTHRPFNTEVVNARANVRIHIEHQFCALSHRPMTRVLDHHCLGRSACSHFRRWVLVQILCLKIGAPDRAGAISFTPRTMWRENG